ncbi:MAG: glutathione S-transferase family protein [Proteobacteria bacterium]|nr:glutathione S-transferase family protein [Pseudomonadota bacterium]
MYRLYQMQDSGNCYKVRLLLHQLQIPCECIEVDILSGESRTETFLEKNINGRVPTLQLDEEIYLPESNAILWYLAEDMPLLPRDKLARAKVLQWMFFEQYSHEPFIATSRFWISILQQADKFADQIEAKRSGGEAALAAMNRHLKINDYFVADQYTIADIALYAYTHVAEEGNFELSPYPAITAWLTRVQSQVRHIRLPDAIT